MVVMTTCNNKAGSAMAASKADLLSVLQASARNGSLLSSCQPEVKELMHQLDVIISTKQREWERERRSLLIKLEHKEKELSNLQRRFLDKSSEVNQLKVIQRSKEEEYHARHGDQEAQLLRVRSEMKRLKASYDQLKARRHLPREEEYHSLLLQVEELKQGMASLEHQLQRKERELSALVKDRGEKMAILNESMRTKDELIRTLEEQMSLSTSSVQFSSYEAEVNQLKETIRILSEENSHLKNELKGVEEEEQTPKNEVIVELKQRVERLETQLRHQHSQDSSAIEQFVDHIDSLACAREREAPPMMNDVTDSSGLAEALEGILDRHFNQLDNSLQAILQSPK